MQFFNKLEKKGHLRPGDPDADGAPTTVTRLVAHEGVDACIFLNRPGFEGGAGCALHIAALEVGERPMDWKPSVCWQVPIRLEHSTDESGHLTSRLREWKRRDWGEGGNDFGWWCTEEPDAFVGAEPLYRSAKDDIIELVGARVYDQMVELARTAGLGARAASRATSILTDRERRSVVGLVVVVEGDAVLLRKRGVLVILGLHWY